MKNKMIMTLCINEESVLLNKTVLEKLGDPRQIQILINEEQGILLLKACEIGDREAVVIPHLLDTQLEVSGSSLLKRIRKLIDWKDDLPRQIEGDFIAEYRAITFDLHAAIPVRLKPKTNIC